MVDNQQKIECLLSYVIYFISPNLFVLLIHIIYFKKWAIFICITLQFMKVICSYYLAEPLHIGEVCTSTIISILSE